MNICLVSLEYLCTDTELGKHDDQCTMIYGNGYISFMLKKLCTFIYLNVPLNICMYLILEH